jgi:hypothetical protein
MKLVANFPEIDYIIHFIGPSGGMADAGDLKSPAR